jgi:peptidyl-tRNA hydrolase, PTH1 family
VANEAAEPLTIVGLGNPGKKYARTRHNLGFLTVEELAGRMNWSFKEDKSLGCKLARGIIDGREVALMLPQTYMNDSGWAVRRYLDYYKMTAGQIIVVSDDTALVYGHLRLRSDGSSGGHNGLKSLEAHLGTSEFIRLRMGVGSKPVGQPLADYVLSDFTQEEIAALDEFVKRGASVLKSLVTEPVTQVMNRVNTKLTL